MPESIDYTITLYPADYERGFLKCTFTLTETYPEREIIAAGMSDLKTQIKAFANEHGEPCCASVRCNSPRKPPGFKKATEDLYYNLEGIAPPHVVERLNALAAA